MIIGKRGAEVNKVRDDLQDHRDPASRGRTPSSSPNRSRCSSDGASRSGARREEGHRVGAALRRTGREDPRAGPERPAVVSGGPTAAPHLKADINYAACAEGRSTYGKIGVESVDTAQQQHKAKNHGKTASVTPVIPSKVRTGSSSAAACAARRIAARASPSATPPADPRPRLDHRTADRATASR